MESRNFYAASVHLNDFYGINMADDQFENTALHAWDHIGNKITRTYRYTATIRNNKIELPCNADIIEAVVVCNESVTTTDGINSYSVGNRNSEIEQRIESLKNSTEFNYIEGAYLDYEKQGDTLYFKVNNVTVSILYKGLWLDDVGLPYLNFKEIDAIAKYCAFIHMQKQAFITKDQATAQMAMLMKQQWQFAVDDARTPIYLNQNDMDNILNVQSSWDRKRYGLSFKPIR